MTSGRDRPAARTSAANGEPTHGGMTERWPEPNRDHRGTSARPRRGRASRRAAGGRRRDRGADGQLARRVLPGRAGPAARGTDRRAAGRVRADPHLGDLPVAQLELPHRRQHREPARAGCRLHAAGDGRGVRAAARRDRPVGGLRRRRRRDRRRRARDGRARRMAMVGRDRGRVAPVRADRHVPGDDHHASGSAVVRRDAGRASSAFQGVMLLILGNGGTYRRSTTKHRQRPGQRQAAPRQQVGS